VYFPHQTFVSNVFEIPISFPFFGVTVFDFVSDKKYENGNDFIVYLPFSFLVVHVSLIRNYRRRGAFVRRGNDYKPDVSRSLFIRE
jgi:hypothetical protein